MKKMNLKRLSKYLSKRELTFGRVDIYHYVGQGSNYHFNLSSHMSKTYNVSVILFSLERRIEVKENGLMKVYILEDLPRRKITNRSIANIIIKLVNSLESTKLYIEGV